MREILFRGKQKINVGWVHGDLSYHRDGRVFIRCWDRLEFDPAYNAYEVYPETVGQFTGLTDKNGKMIFEGDILKEPDVTHNGETQIIGHILSVEMRKGCWCVLSKNYFDGWDFLNSNTKLCEVIGNIHDNPELLEGA